jgi:hypothetical protein
MRMPTTSQHVSAIAAHKVATPGGGFRLDLRLYIGPGSTGLAALEEEHPRDTFQSHDIAQLVSNIAIVVSRVHSGLPHQEHE